jgi:hypothetical protein
VDTKEALRAAFAIAAAHRAIGRKIAWDSAAAPDRSGLIDLTGTRMIDRTEQNRGKAFQILAAPPPSKLTKPN